MKEMFNIPEECAGKTNDAMLRRLEQLSNENRDLRTLVIEYRSGNIKLSSDSDNEVREIVNMVPPNVDSQNIGYSPRSNSPMSESQDNSSLSGLGENLGDEGDVALAIMHEGVPPIHNVQVPVPQRPVVNRVIGYYKNLPVIESPLAEDNVYMPCRKVLIGNHDAVICNSVLDPDVTDCLRLLPVSTEHIRFKASRPVIHDSKGNQYHLTATPLPYCGQNPFTDSLDQPTGILYRNTLQNQPQLAAARDVRTNARFMSTRLVQTVDSCCQAPAGADGVLMQASVDFENIRNAFTNEQGNRQIKIVNNRPVSGGRTDYYLKLRAPRDSLSLRQNLLPRSQSYDSRFAHFMQDTTFLLGGWTDRLKAFSWQNKLYTKFTRSDSEVKRTNRLMYRFGREQWLHMYRDGFNGETFTCPINRGATYRGHANPECKVFDGVWPVENALRKWDSFENLFHNGGIVNNNLRDLDRANCHYGGGMYFPYLGVTHLIDMPIKYPRDRFLPQSKIQESCDMYYRVWINKLQMLPLPNQYEPIDRNNHLLWLPEKIPNQPEQVTRWQKVVLAEIAPRIRCSIFELEQEMDAVYKDTYPDSQTYLKFSNHHGKPTQPFLDDPDYPNNISDYQLVIPDRLKLSPEAIEAFDAIRYVYNDPEAEEPMFYGEMEVAEEEVVAGEEVNNEDVAMG